MGYLGSSSLDTKMVKRLRCRSHFSTQTIVLDQLCMLRFFSPTQCVQLTSMIRQVPDHISGKSCASHRRHTGRQIVSAKSEAESRNPAIHRFLV